MKKVEKYYLKAVSSELKPFCYMAEKDDFIEVVYWNNGEGYDVHISNTVGDKTLSFTEGEFNAIKKLIKELDD